MKILFVSPVKWCALKQRHQGLANEMAKEGHKVYYVNPIQTGGFSLHSYEESNLSIIDVKMPYKASSKPFFQRFIVKLALKLILKKFHLNSKEVFLWLAEPSSAVMVESPWKQIAYDCCDYHGAFPGQKGSVWRYYEDIITEKANYILLSHPFLKEHFSKEDQEKTILLPNATSYKTEPVKNEPIKGKIKMISSGAHYEWVDIGWLKKLSERDNVELHIAGSGRGAEFNELIKSKNVIFHGSLSQEELWQLMRDCHFGLLAFKDIELIKGVDPIKAYDYAAAGLRILSPLSKDLLLVGASDQPIPTWATRYQSICHLFSE